MVGHRKNATADTDCPMVFGIKPRAVHFAPERAAITPQTSAESDMVDNDYGLCPVLTWQTAVSTPVHENGPLKRQTECKLSQKLRLPPNIMRPTKQFIAHIIDQQPSRECRTDR